MNDDRPLRDAYDELVAARAPATRTACPAPEALLAVVEREGAEDARLATLDHVMGCAACRRELDFLRAGLAAATTASGVTAARAPRAAFHIPLRPLAMAAGIIVVIGVGVVVREQRGDDARTLRGGVTAIRLGVPEPSADGGVVLRWGRVADATRYRVEVFTGTGTTVAEATVSDTTFVVQPIALASTTEPLQWMVTALRADGGEQRSATGRIVR